MTIRVKMIPHPDRIRSQPHGIARVVEAYGLHLPKFDVEVVPSDTDTYDLRAVHAGVQGRENEVCHSHGIYFTADYNAAAWEYKANKNVIAALRSAREITVPSHWVAEAIARGVRILPHVIPHGIDWDNWQHSYQHVDYVLWNKNRDQDVCSPIAVGQLAQAFPDVQFVTTFALPEHKNLSNVKVTGRLPFDKMKPLVQQAGVYLATTKETFGIGILEAMSSGVPILGYAHGGILDTVKHGVSGYLARPNDVDDLSRGLAYCMEHRKILGANARELSKEWTWEAAVKLVAGVYRLAMEPSPPTVAVVIPSYNYAHKVGRAVLSALVQDYPHLTDIIVIDDGSPDDGATERAVEAVEDEVLTRIEDLQATVNRLRGEYRETLTLDENGKALDTGPNSPAALGALEETSIGLAIALEARRRLSLLRYVRQPNGGVAIARNHGISLCDTKYVCCLDADDAIDPSFLSTCISPLEKDSTLGLSYTRLDIVLHDDSDGRRGPLRWPGRYNYDLQIEGHNQVPTCCVFRRDLWQRLGGYRQRYAPRGCGTEDAEFWLRMGSIGYGGHLATNEALFVYSYGTGATTNSEDYREVDWLAWHPWVKDNRHPFASVATPAQDSHPVRQYDEPTVSVVIPVGPGHAEQVINALDSLEAQTFRKWETILVWDGIDLSSPAAQRIQTAYPYVLFLSAEDNIPGHGKGAGWARNLGARSARASLLLFLDADDWLYPEFMERTLMAYHGTDGDAAIYTDHVAMALIDDVQNLPPEEISRIKHREGNWTVLGRAKPEYDQNIAFKQPDPDRPYVWCDITVLHPTSWFHEVGGFDETMSAWEDWDYWLRLAIGGKCFLHLPEELWVYQYYSGSRREGGRQDWEFLVQYMRGKYEKMTRRSCRGCSSQGSRIPPALPQPLTATAAGRSDAMPNDADFVRCEYTHPNRGDHSVVGPAGFNVRLAGVNMIPKRGGDGAVRWHINYGYIGGGTKLLAHKRDIALAPHYFRSIETVAEKMVLPVQKVQSAVPPPPQSVEGTALKRPPVVAPPIQAIGDVENVKPTGLAAEMESLLQATSSKTTLETLPEPLDLASAVAQIEVIPTDPVEGMGGTGIATLPPIPSIPSDLQLIPGITPEVATNLRARGVNTGQALAAFVRSNNKTALMAVRGIGKARAEAMIDYVKSLDG